MSRDIRSYFSFGTTAKKPSVSIDDSPKNSSVKERNKVAGGKKTKHVIRDSDSEEDPLPPSPKRRKNSSGKKKPIAKEKPNLVPVNIADVFGSKPVERVEKPPKINESVTVKKEPQDDNSLAPTVTLESSDDDFSTEKKDEKVETNVSVLKKETKIKSEEEIKCEEEVKCPKKDKKRSESDVKVKNESEKTPTKVKDVKIHHEREEADTKPVSDGDSAEKKKQHAIMYQKYLHREGPKHLGSKEIPKGDPNCLNGLVFVITGVLDSLDRDDASALVQRCGGKVTSSVSRNTSYIVLGDEPGPAKLAKAKNLGIKELDEDGLLDLIRKRSEETTSTEEKPLKSPANVKKRQKEDHEESSYFKAPKISKLNEDEKTTNKSKDAKRICDREDSKAPKISKLNEDEKTTNKSKDTKRICDKEDRLVDQPKEITEMWVDKYKPTSTKQIIGQQGDRSNVNKLKRWLSNWHKYHGKGGTRPPRPGPWDKNDDGGFYKAALLSGPPGIGKTTSAHLVCEELGMDAIELNASDTRSKKLLEQEVAELVTNQTLTYFTHGGAQSAKSNGRNKVLLMDEVDGMAGNEDRGGVAALIQLIKESCIPIICMCNDRSHPKIRSLVGHCYDLRYQRPRMEQIRGAMMSICFKEGLKVSSEALGDLITSTNQDVRQVLHQLNMWAADKNIMHKSEAANKKKSLKDVRLGPWDVLRKVFSAEERKNTDIKQQSDLFFYDYNLGPLFVYENYPMVSPNSARNMKQKLGLLSQTAESLVKGDIIQRVIRRDNAWKLLPAQAIFSSVLPGYLMEGHVTGLINFPAFLGKTSTKGKMERLIQEITMHTKTTTRATKKSMKLDYLSYLRDAIVKPLVMESQGELAPGEGVHKSIEVMHGYSLLREDLDSILELTHFPGMPDPMSHIQSKVKAAFTRAYNKEGIMTPYSVTMSVRKKKGTSIDYGSDEDEIEEEENEENDADPLADAMIKVKQPSSSRGGRGKGGRGAGSSGAGSSGAGSSGAGSSGAGSSGAGSSRGKNSGENAGKRGRGKRGK